MRGPSDVTPRPSMQHRGTRADCWAWMTLPSKGSSAPFWPSFLSPLSLGPTAAPHHSQAPQDDRSSTQRPRSYPLVLPPGSVSRLLQNGLKQQRPSPRTATLSTGQPAAPPLPSAWGSYHSYRTCNEVHAKGLECVFPGSVRPMRGGPTC